MNTKNNHVQCIVKEYQLRYAILPIFTARKTCSIDLPEAVVISHYFISFNNNDIS